MEAQNTKVVQDAYAALGRGDVPAILASLADDIVYTTNTSIGKSVASDFAMVFTLRGGKMVAFQEFCNSAAIDAAYAA